MNILHNVRFRAYSHATEDQSKVESALKFVSGAQELNREMLKGHYGSPLIKIIAFLKKRKDLDAFLDRMRNAGILPEVLSTLNRRVDEEGSLYIRVSKQAAYEGRIEMTEKDDSISIKAKVRSYPASREEAMKILRESLQEE